MAESKNGSVVRKHLGYSHIPSIHAGRVNAFAMGFLSPYLNFHRPCFFAEEIVNDKGRVSKRYRYEQMMTPYDKLKSLDNAESFLKTGISFQQLDEIAMKESDDEPARKLNIAHTELFQSINQSQAKAA